MPQSNILLIVGGTWHKFDAFATDIVALLRSEGHLVETTYELTALKDLSAFDLVMMYTCLTHNKEDGTPASMVFRDEDAAPLATWVSAGGKLLMLHAATIACQTSPALCDLTGGKFISHPPMSTFTLYPMHAGHPITAGVAAFDVFDEFYIQEVTPDITVHMIALNEGQAHPVVWTRSEGHGQIAYLSMGHDERVWNLPAYRQLLKQAVAWLAESQARSN